MLFRSLLVNRVGVQAAGIGYCASYLFYIIVVASLARKSLQWRPSPEVVLLIFIGVILMISIGITSTFTPIIGLVSGTFVALVGGIFSIRRLKALDALPQPLTRFLYKLKIL